MAHPHPASPGFLYNRRILREPDEFDDAVSGMNLAVDFQLRQQCASHVHQFQAPEWALDYGQANVRTRVRGVVLHQWASFCFSKGPAPASWNSQEAGTGTVGLLPPGGEADGRTEAGFTWITAALPPALWERSLALAGVEADFLPRLTVCTLPTGLLDSLQQNLGLLRQRLLHSTADPALDPTLGRDATLLISGAFTRLCELASGTPVPRDSLRNRSRLVRRAETWLRDHLQEPVQVPDLCLALGVSRREMEYAFRSILQQSPRDYLQLLRLNAIRRALLRSDGGASIIEIAYAHGVTHLGRFSANYTRLFGEKPSATLRR